LRHYRTNPIAHLRSGQIRHSSGLGLDQVVAVNGGGHGHVRQAAADELEHRHLGRGVLHGHAVGPQPQVSAPAVDLLRVGVVEVAVHDLLRQGERPVEPGREELKNSILFVVVSCNVRMKIQEEQVR